MEYVQNDIFSELYPKFTITKPIRLVELFAGIGSQAKALRNLGADFTTWKVVEFDKYAIKSYNAIHGTGFETSDIREIHAADLEIVNRDKYCYILTYSFPCQDLSAAGHQRGMKKGSGTRSGLLWEVERILDECGAELPHVLLMENVPMVISDQNINDFYEWRGKLEKIGYSSYVSVLNAKDYGIPQNRNRCFMVSILGEYSYTFTHKQNLKLCLRDVLEENVADKYYFSDIESKFVVSEEKHCKELKLSDEEMPKVTDGLIIAGTFDRKGWIDLAKRVYDPQGIAPTLNTMQGGGRHPKILDFAYAGLDGKPRIYSDTAPTLNARDYKEPKCVIEQDKGMRIRKLTPKECWRLMGFSDTDFEKAEAVNSSTQLYKQAGNSIVVNVLMAIFAEMLPKEE